MLKRNYQLVPGEERAVTKEGGEGRGKRARGMLVSRGSNENDGNIITAGRAL